MATIAGLRPPIHEALRRVAAPAPVTPAALLLLAMALGGLGLTVLGRSPSPSAATPPATVVETGAADLPIGDLPIIGDPIRDLTIWWSNRLSDANKASLTSLQGRFLTPIDALADDTVKNLYGKILLITIPLLTLGGIVLGYLIMVSRTTGESAYTARAVTPRFVVGATLSVLGIFIASVFAQFVIATDAAMVGVAIGSNALGGSDAWPASGGVFGVLQNGGFDPRTGALHGSRSRGDRARGRVGAPLEGPARADSGNVGSRAGRPRGCRRRSSR